MNRFLILPSAICLAIGAATASAATVITFDDITPNHNANFGPNFAIVADGYAGLNWTNTIVEAASSFIPGSLNLNVSVPNVATDSNYLGYTLTAAPIQFSSDVPFELDTAYFIANQVEGLNIQVQGLRDGIVVDSKTLTVGTSAPVLGVFDWANVDTVIMTTSGGSNPSAHLSFSFDNLVINGAAVSPPVPEPSSVAMLLAGIGLVGAWARRQRAS